MENIGSILSTMGLGQYSKPVDLEAWECEQYNKQPGNLNEFDGVDCPACKNKGFVMKTAGTITPCECQVRRKNIRRMKASGLRNVENFRFKNFDAAEEWQKKLKERAIEYSKDPKGWFFVGGQVGAGKSHICTAICANILTKMGVIYFLWRDEAARLKSAMVEDPGYYASRMSDVKNTTVLYIDDLFKAGNGAATAADVNLAFEILNFRYLERKATIISSERTLGEISDVDEAVGSRIYEMCRGGNAISIGRDPKKNHRLRECDNLKEVLGL